MREIHATSLTDFDSIFNDNNPEIPEGICEGIQKAIDEHSHEAVLFRIFTDETEEIDGDHFDISFDLNLDSGQWAKALSKALEKFEQLEMYDAAIDCHLLLKTVLKDYEQDKE